MKHIFRNNIVAVEASIENPNFPASQLLDQHPKRKYKAGDSVNSATLSCDIIGGCSDIMIAGTNATSAEGVVQDPNLVKWADAFWGEDSGALIPAAAGTLNNQLGEDNVRAVFIYDIRKDSDLGVKAAELGFGNINLVAGQIPTTPPLGLTIRTVGGAVIYTKNFATDIVAVYMLNCVAYAVMVTGELWSYNFITLVETTNGSITGSANDMKLWIPIGRSNSIDDEMPDPAILLGTNDKAILLDGPAGVGTTVTLCDASGDDINNVAVSDSYDVWMVNETQASVDVFHSATTLANSTTPDHQFDTTTRPALLSNPTTTKHGFCSCGDYIAYGSVSGLTLVGLDKYAFINKDYNTGWMGTGAKRAFLCEAVGDTSLATTSLPEYSGTGGTLTIAGTLTMSPMASGADKQGASGWSTSNYGSQAYSADLDFGTDDFHVEFALYQTLPSSTELIVSRAYYTGGAYSGSSISSQVLNDGRLQLIISDDGFSTYDAISTTSSIIDGNIGVYCLQRVGGVLQIWRNGVKIATDKAITNATGSLSNANATLMIGKYQGNTNPLTNGKLSSLKISSGSLTEDQIIEQYESERWMYAASAKCTIMGSSDAVKCCDFDFEKQQLAVATSAGVTVFRNFVVMEDSYKIITDIPAYPRALSVCNGNMLYGTEILTYKYLAPYYPDESTEWANKEIFVTGSAVQQSKSSCLWITLSDSVNVPAVAALTIRSAKWTGLEAGVITGGLAETYGGEPLFGITVESIDYSIKEENSNGSMYYKQRDIVRSFDAELEITRENAIKFLDNFIEMGETASAWKMSDLTGNEWVVYGKLNETPVIRHDNYAFSSVSFNVLEVL